MHYLAKLLGGVAFVAGISVVAFAAFCPPLTIERVEAALRSPPVLSFYVETGLEHPELTCAQVEGAHERRPEREAAIAAGWLARTCEEDHIRLRLTPEGTRRSARWERSSDRLTQAQEATEGSAVWCVTVAHFERVGAPEIQWSNSWNDKSVVLRGRWVPNDEGQLLKDVGWDEIDKKEHSEYFLRHWGGWSRVSRPLGD